KAGESFRYNPLMYSWASRPMAEMTGEPFSALVERYVFLPAGMTRSARKHRNLPLRTDLAEALARPYHLDASGTLVRSEDPPPQGDGAAGGVISTVLDLVKFDVALGGGKLISPASVRQMMTPMRNAAGTALPYGLGWFIQDYRGHKLVWHSGWWEKAYSALYLKVPDRHLTMILLANSEGVWWDNPLDKAEVEKSPFAAAFLERFVGE
ncbi:MAG TPA: serine hydrolase domain-containing protein, partial [Thermoanaerobaculia bacterium]|nr:serine hydrolase domain-containing protein [Thermoanaerobaculia bacterium]